MSQTSIGVACDGQGMNRRKPILRAESADGTTYVDGCWLGAGFDERFGSLSVERLRRLLGEGEHRFCVPLGFGCAAVVGGLAGG